MRRRGFLTLATGVAACGYRPLRAGLAGHPKIRVASAVARIPSAHALGEEVATGARAELARNGALASDGVPLRIEIVRFEELGEGDEVVAGSPIARGVRVRLVARGAIEGGDFETDDQEATEVVASGGGVLAFDAARAGAARGAARRAGALVARAVLGLPG